MLFCSLLTNAIAQCDGLDLDGCIPTVTLDYLPHDHVDNDNDPCWDMFVAISNFPTNCPCSIDRITFEFDIDSNSDGVYDLTQLIGTYTIGASGTNSTFSLNPYLPQFVGPMHNPIGGVNKFPKLQTMQPLIFDVQGAHEIINVRTCYQLDCDGSPDCANCYQEEIRIVCD